MATPHDHGLPELATAEACCGADAISMRTVQLVLSCARCGQPRITITGCPGHLAVILADLA